MTRAILALGTAITPRIWVIWNRSTSYASIQAALLETQRERRRIPVYLDHDYYKPIGRVVNWVGNALTQSVDAVLLITDPSAMHGITNGTLTGLSISYDPRKERLEDGVTRVDDFRLCEISLCAFPANEDCHIRCWQEITLKP